MSTPDSMHADQALNAYLALLKANGAATAHINLRKHLLRHLLSVLEEVSLEQTEGADHGYRLAVDRLLGHFPDEQHVEIISTAREFYPFWVGDLRTIAKLNAAKALTTQHIPLDISGSLTDMLERMDADDTQHAEPPVLCAYIEMMASQGVESAVIDIRERLLRLLLYVIRNADPVPTAYRAGVDAMLTLFPREDTRQAFIEVAREFFHFWNDSLTCPPRPARHSEAIRAL
ncbi:hypothetical protein [Parachitinimonas caeni]|uniref:Uncharacterized protein n=1 Tax=Parachitinimonas caeni TaxID=3031301 RepID=A0ABT7DZN4_9NEIS|nr:hypothetical protein [Parachitinimonas caeni]MDK2125526.1 hypothetical protein [Parachitinimonas caeni]